VEVALVDWQPPFDRVALDANDLDPESARKAPLEAPLEELGAQLRSSAAPSS
jgi:hypothetical protein